MPTFEEDSQPMNKTILAFDNPGLLEIPIYSSTST